MNFLAFPVLAHFSPLSVSNHLLNLTKWSFSSTTSNYNTLIHSPAFSCSQRSPIILPLNLAHDCALVFHELIFPKLYFFPDSVLRTKPVGN